MHWLIYYFIHVIAFVVKDVSRKRLLIRHDNLAVLSVEFGFTFLIVLTAALVLKIDLSLTGYALIFLIIGLVHGMGTIGKIHAMDVSMSATNVFSNFVVLPSIILSLMFLKELELFDPTSWQGGLRLMMMILFPLSLQMMKKSKMEHEKAVKLIWFANMAVFLVFHGTLDFFVKVFISASGIMQALVYRRLGAFVAVMIGAVRDRVSWPKDKRFWTIGLFNAGLISLTAWTNTVIMTLAPVSVYVPLRKMSTSLGNTAAGLFLFHERKKLDRFAVRGYILAGLGSILLILAEL